MRALVLDNSALQRKFVSWLLREFKGLEVQEFAEGEPALAALRETPFDIVIMELKLGAIDGLALLKTLRVEPGPNAQVHVMVITSLGDADHEERARALGVDEYVTKPVAAVRIRDTVKDLLRWPDPQSGDDSAQRRSARLNLPVSVTFEGLPPVELVTADISLFGAFIISDHPMPKGTEGRLALRLPHLDQPIDLQFRVMHSRALAIGQLPAGFGVRFLSDNLRDVGRLAEAFSTPNDDSKR
jgi:CheY-like chemotaxis protein